MGDDDEYTGPELDINALLDYEPPGNKHGRHERLIDLKRDLGGLPR